MGIISYTVKVRERILFDESRRYIYSPIPDGQLVYILYSVETHVYVACFVSTT